MRLLKPINLIVMITAIIGITVIPMAFAETLVPDPMNIGVGARPLGMGKAYVAIAEDGDTIFINPAGLGKVNSFKLTSMYANLLGDVNYTVLAGAMPINDLITIGGGGIMSSVSSIPLFSDTAEPLGSGELTKSVMFVSCGIDLGSVQVGTNLKYFAQSGSGPSEVEVSNGSGYDMDLGVLYSPNSWLSLGANQQNLLGSNMTYASGLEEKIESITKVGIKLGVLGKDALMSSGQKLILGADADLTQNGTILHVGAEYRPIEIIALRAGLDQDQGADETVNNITFGVGIKLMGVEFDYAYHPYSDIPENTTHYFSISYVGTK